MAGPRVLIPMPAFLSGDGWSAGPVTPGRGDAGRLVSLIALVSLAGACAIGIWLTARSLRWHFYQDALVMHYIAARILDGAVPYRDMIDMNFPATYLIHTLGLLSFGPSDAGGRAFDLAILAGTCAGLATALWSYGPWASAFAAVGFWVYHLGLGSLNAGQRDFVMCLPLAWMTAAAIAHVRTGRLFALGASAFCLSVVIWMKPSGILLVPVLAALVWRRGARARGPAFAAVALGLGLASAGVGAWLASRGGVAPFAGNAWRVVSHYASLANAPFSTLIKGHRYARNFAPWAALGLLALRRTGQLDARAGVLLAGAGYSVLHYFLQAKGWEYHLYPAALFAMAIGGAGVAVALAHRRVVLTAALAVAFGLAILALGLRGPREDPSGQEWRTSARPRALAELLSPLITPGASVQTLDSGTDAGIHTLYLLRLRQPTPILYDHFLFEHAEDPWHRELRRRFVEALADHPPVAILLFEESWPRSVGYARVHEFPELETLLDHDYRRVVDGLRVRVYTRRDAVSPPLRVPPVLERKG